MLAPSLEQGQDGIAGAISSLASRQFVPVWLGLSGAYEPDRTQYWLGPHGHRIGYYVHGYSSLSYRCLHGICR